MARPAAQRARGADVPEEDLLVAADGGEARVVRGEGEVEDFVAVGGVGLDEVGGGGVGGVGEVDGAVCGAGEEVLACAGGEGEAVDGAGVGCEGGCEVGGEGRHRSVGCGVVGGKSAGGRKRGLGLKFGVGLFSSFLCMYIFYG